MEAFYFLEVRNGDENPDEIKNNEFKYFNSYIYKFLFGENIVQKGKNLILIINYFLKY